MKARRKFDVSRLLDPAAKVRQLWQKRSSWPDIRRWGERIRMYPSQRRKRETVASGRWRHWLNMDLGMLLQKIREADLRLDSSPMVLRIGQIGDWPWQFRWLVLVVMCFLTAWFSGAWLSEAVRLERQQLKQESELLQTRYVQYLGRQATLSETDAQITALQAQFGEFLDMAAGSVELIHVLKQINLAAREAGLQIDTFRPLPEERHAYYTILPVDIRLKGDFHGIGYFMELVSRMQHLITVDVQLTAVPAPGSGVVLASRLRAYRYDPAAEKAGEGGAR